MHSVRSNLIWFGSSAVLIVGFAMLATPNIVAPAASQQASLDYKSQRQQKFVMKGDEYDNSVRILWDARSGREEPAKDELFEARLKLDIMDAENGKVSSEQLDLTDSTRTNEAWFNGEHRVVYELPLDLKPGHHYLISCIPLYQDRSFDRFRPVISIGLSQYGAEGNSTSPRHLEVFLIFVGKYLCLILGILCLIVGAYRYYSRRNSGTT